MEDTAHRAIAVVGLSAIMPDAPDAQSFWENIKNGRYSITEVPTGRWDPELYYDSDRKAPGKTYSKIGGWVREWPWEPFKWHLPIPPKISDAMDAGQQWAVALAHEVLSGHGEGGLPLDRERTAVVLGNAMGGEQAFLTSLRICYPEFAQILADSPAFQGLSGGVRTAMESEIYERFARDLPDCTEDTMPGELSNCMAGRIANLFDLKGPNFVCDAACASALAAMDAAVEGLIENEYDAVLTGGVDRNMGASSFVKFCKIGALSATGTRPYADGADGFVMGEGGALFLLKRLADAERDGDTIYAVLRGIGGSSDGRGKGITAPNPVGQKLAIQRAWKNAGLDPSSVSLLEGHGTSTKVGDVVEFGSLDAIFGASGLEPGAIALGSVKSNIGHLKSGAGAAGFFKAVMALHEKVLPPSLNFDSPNPNIDFSQTPIRVNTQLRDWDQPAQGDGIRRAAVSAFGFGGTNFHAVLEEYLPGRLQARRPVPVAAQQIVSSGSSGAASAGQPKAPLQGALVLGAESKAALNEKLQQTIIAGSTPAAGSLPAEQDLRAAHRLAIAYQNPEELLTRLQRAAQAFKADQGAVWKALRSQGIFYGSGPAPKVAFLYTGQGSQYANMLAELRDCEPVVAATFAEADRVMKPLIGRPLSELIFVDPDDSAAVEAAERELRRTEITQPAILTVDCALTRLFAAYGIQPDMVIGHSLGEYGALVASGALPFEDALQAVSARGRGMTEVAEDDNGLMAAVFAPLEQIRQVVDSIQGNVVIANINSNSQAVIGGASDAVQRAMDTFTSQGVEVAPLPVSHAFHTSIVAAASGPLRESLTQLRMAPPVLPLVSNVTGDFYPMTAGVEPQMVDMLAQQVASPVQFVKGLNTLYQSGARVFLEVGPKKALQGFADDVLGRYDDVLTLFSNHPRTGEIPSFNQALCGLYSAGLGVAAVSAGQPVAQLSSVAAPVAAAAAPPMPSTTTPVASGPVTSAAAVPPDRYQQLGQLFANFLEQSVQVFSGNTREANGGAMPFSAPVVTGAALGLPGTERIFDDANVQRILGGEQEIKAIPTRFRQSMVDKHITRLVKTGGGGPHFETISSSADVIKLAGRGGALDLEQDYGVPGERVEALDVTTQLAIAAGIDALRDAGIPLVMQYRTTHVGSKLPERWMLPEQLRDETAVIFAAAFPGYDSFADELTRYQQEHDREAQLEALQSLRGRLAGNDEAASEIDRQIQELQQTLEREPYTFNRRFLFRALAMGHSQMAEYIGARGPNTHINSACASTTQAFALAEDWIRVGRCRRVVIIAADDVTSDHLLEWVGAGFLASGAAATDERVEEAALPFDRRRHGMILGMGACGVVVESPEAAAERGIRPICELLSTVTANSAFHGTRLNIDHICQVMEQVVAQAEQRFGIDRRAMAAELLFVSHETYTPARGGSASAEVHALRKTFGEAADSIVVANTKGLTGHAMGVGIEDTVAIKALETGVVPPVANFHEQDPELGPLNLSRGGAYPIRYALRLGAGFGSQISLSLMRWTPSADGSRPRADQLGYEYRLHDQQAWRHWLQQVSGSDTPQLEVVQRTLRVQESPGAGRSSGQAPAVAQPVTAAAAPVAPAPVAAPVLEQPEVPAAAAATDPVTEQVLAIVAQITGYPTDMLDPELDLEADLGIDTVKQAETFAAIREQYDIPRDENLKLRDYSTIARAVQFVRERRPDLAAAPATPVVAATAAVPTPTATAEAAPAAAAGADPVTEQVLAIVAQITGYPTDMLDPELDLEADLGIDTVKQAETFAAIREQYDIPRDENLQLRDYSTIARAVQFVRERRPDLAAAPTAPVVAATAAAPTPTATAEAAPAAAAGADPVTEQVLAIVSQITGYPSDMLDPELDLEADLGIDTVKQAETFAAIREQYDIPRDENLQLRDYSTIARAVQFVHERRPDLAVAAAPAAAPPPPVAAEPAATSPAAATDPVTEQVLSIVSQITGYPTDMLDLELDLEADLGIDTVKQAETFAAIREQYGIPRDENLQLRDYSTIARAVQFVHERRPDLAATGASAPAATAPGAARAADQPGATSDLQSGDMAATLALPRRIPAATLRPELALCRGTGIELGEGSRVIVMPDTAGVAKALVQRLSKRGVDVLELDPEMSREQLVAQIEAWLQQGAINGLYWLPALDTEEQITRLELSQWQQQLELRVKLLYCTGKALYEQFAQPGRFMLAATRLGGRHGYDDAGALAPMGGAVTGFAKAYSRERGEALVKAVDFAASRKTAAIADALIEETLHDPGAVEIGRYRERRWGVGLVEQPAENGARGLSLDGDSVFVVTGAAGSIVSAITADLATVSAGTYYLLDLAPEPDPENADIGRVTADRDGLKRDIFERLRAAGERATPALVEKQIAGLERANAALSAIESIRSAGGTVHYRQLDLTRPDDVAAVIAEVREAHGRIDVLLHAAGIEISHTLPDKPEQEFDLVFDIKCNGWFNLLHAIGDMELASAIVFSSIAGRFGNLGQTDYSAANDLMCKSISTLRRTHPATRGIAIDWTAWADIGMASRGSIPAMMEAAGIDMLAPGAGIPVIRHELTAGDWRGELVVAERLGALMQARADNGGLDIEALGERITGPMIGRIVGISPSGELQVETPLSPAEQPFLYDHQIDGTAVLPGVMAVEAFAELATLIAPSLPVRAVEDVEFLAPLKFYRSEPQTLYLGARFGIEGEELVAYCQCASRRKLHGRDDEQVTTHFLATIRLGGDVPAARSVAVPDGSDLPAIAAKDLYQVYFHGPAYQVLDAAWCAGDRVVGQMRTELPANHHPGNRSLALDPRLIELCFQTAGAWEIGVSGSMALPRRIKRIALLSEPGQAISAAHAVVSPHAGGSSFDAAVVDESGRVIVALENYESIEYPGAIEESILAPFKASMNT